MSACGSVPPWGETLNTRDEGSASFTVTYLPAPDADPVTVDVEMDSTDCYVAGDVTSFGADVDPDARLRHAEAVAADPSAVLGFHEGAVSGAWSVERFRDFGLSIELPDGHLYVSTEAFEMSDGAFEVVEHEGWVGTGGTQESTSAVDDDARATGSFSCGPTGPTGP